MNKVYKIIFFLFILFFAKNLFAADLSLFVNQDSVSINQEFYVDLNIIIQDEIINGIEGVVLYDASKIQFVRSENSRSFVTHWINEPKVLDNKKIVFSGILPNGFGGFLNLPENNIGNVTRLVFRPVDSGVLTIGVQDVFVTKNDGNGTMIKLKDQGQIVEIKSSILESTYSVVDFNEPILNAEIIRDHNLYNNEPTLVFNATDKESGVEGVYIKNKKNWIRIDNPYNISNVNLYGILSVKAVDHAGNFSIKRFVLPGYGVNSKNLIFTSFIIVIVIFGFMLVYKKYAKNK